MGFNDWVNRGGLFGGFGQYDRLSEESRRRANRRGLLAGGAYLLDASMQPGNFAYGGNIASALLMGRDEFDQSLERAADYERQLMLDRERRLAAFKEEQAARDEALRVAQQEEAEENDAFDKWSTSALVKNDMADYVHRKRPDLDPELLANLPDQMLKKLFDEASATPKPTTFESEGGRRYRVDASGETFVGFDPERPDGPKTGKTPEELRAAELAERDKIEAKLRGLKRRDLGKDGVTIVELPVYGYDDEAKLQAAVDAEMERRRAFIAGRSAAATGAPPPPTQELPTADEVRDKLGKHGEDAVLRAMLAKGVPRSVAESLIRAARGLP